MWDLSQCQKFQSRGPVPPFREVLRRLATRWNWWMGSACKWCWSTAQGLKISCGIANCSSYMYAHASAEGCEMIVTGPKIVLPIFDVLATKNLLGTAQKTGSATSCHSLLCPAALLSNHEYGLIKRLECNCEFIGCSFVLTFFPSLLCLFEFHLSFTSEVYLSCGMTKSSITSMMKSQKFIENKWKIAKGLCD